ncbi:metal ABC transporter permease, partial [Bacillus safensis]|uniref:metal ABC transporter permease n=1 Tax=Bacillus safensis TaxID=561879 RepID=UPI00135599E2
VIGGLLGSALMTLPVSIAMRWTKWFKQFILISIIIGEFSVIVWLVTAFYLKISPGGIIVVILFIMLGLTLFYQSFVTGKLKGVKRNENGRSHSYIEK